MDDEPTYYVRCTGDDCNYAEAKRRDRAKSTQRRHTCPNGCNCGLATAPLDAAPDSVRTAALADSGPSVTEARVGD